MLLKFYSGSNLEQKFISGFRQSRTPIETGTGTKGKRNREQITVEQKLKLHSGAG